MHWKAKSCPTLPPKSLNTQEYRQVRHKLSNNIECIMYALTTSLAVWCSIFFYISNLTHFMEYLPRNTYTYDVYAFSQRKKGIPDKPSFFMRQFRSVSGKRGFVRGKCQDSTILMVACEVRRSYFKHIYISQEEGCVIMRSDKMNQFSFILRPWKSV